MKSDKYHSVDELIKRSLKEQLEENIDVDMELAWEKYNKRYHQEPKKLSKWPVIACSFVLCLVVGFWLMPKEGTALNLKFFESICTFVTGKVQTVQISFGTQKNAKDLDNPLKPEVSQALATVPYEVLLPYDLAGQYTIEKALIEEVGDSTKVILFLETTNLERLTISEVNIIGDFNQAIAYDTEDAVMENVNVMGQEANLLLFKDGKKQLLWVDRDIFVTITGSLSEKDLFVLAGSLRRITLQ
ncbi:DUF4367 domain-containing protein [Desulforamulus aeronauticus]|uniref:DUF4367 domain-containing protein n=1 Tax=Desulforamulus aeronauticus DSM 10349 TaxID=1121421 RepID=A0A1M6VSE0_9FIRM|nr:DUF4367 domain-containing protein [Desulforamulus aeronauticus]SHK84301.1 protein of unknown function [Desulforamulus aeronauticus DSM 10349]